ncbi:MAG: cytochrome-c peroxidase, partial [Gemmatimonadaceae bacterium]
ADGRPPMFTDFEYEALGVPRNLATATGARGPDLGLCGPARTDLATQTTFCGMFRTPSLRNVATRAAFFHNGEARTLDEVLRFYAFRDTRPDLVYPRDAAGVPARFDDLPAPYRTNIDVADPPFNRKPGDPPPMSSSEMRDIIAFLKTLTDGYRETAAGR